MTALAKLRACAGRYPRLPLCVVWPEPDAVDGWGVDWLTPHPPENRP